MTDSITLTKAEAHSLLAAAVNAMHMAQGNAQTVNRGITGHVHLCQKADRVAEVSEEAFKAMKALLETEQG
jgi:hypothetical protein